MPLSRSRWKSIAESRYAHEREALEFLREELPDSELTLVYSNFEFIADDGTVNEVDALVVSRAGMFLLEIKGRGGVVKGSRHVWDWGKEGHVVAIDSPLINANAKARKLASMIGRQRPFAKDRKPWMEALVFLSDPQISIQLPESERMRLCTRLPREKAPGILAALTQGDFIGSNQFHHTAFDKAMVRRIAQAIDDLRIRPCRRERQVGDYILRELLEENPFFLYQDFHAEHPTSKAVRRVRLYNCAADEPTRKAVRQAALQEFQILETLDHPGILPALDFNEHEIGPSILFRREATEIRLDHYLRQKGTSLPLDIKLDLARQIAEAVRYAHNHQVIHRALSPKSILVLQPDTDKPQVRLMNWQAGRQVDSGASGAPSTVIGTATLLPSQFAEESILVYLAPEALIDPRLRSRESDIFSLGAITYHLLSGQPPATSATQLQSILAQHGGLSLSVVLDGVQPCLHDLVQKATNSDLLLRTETASDFLLAIDNAEDELTRPAQESVAAPLDAKPGDLLEHGLKLKRRLGGGSSAVTLLVEKDGKELVLKVARTPEDSDRLASEHRTVLLVEHPLIVKAEKELLTFEDGRTGFLMEYLGHGTLAQKLTKEGRLSLEFLQRFGEDLLRVVEHLEEVGIGHRDLKPDNIGIQEFGKNDQRRLKIFDFSLSNAPLDQVRAGTPPYLEPFLQLPSRGRWDTAAERYAAAVILYEMATGTTPRWGDGVSAPHLIRADITIESDLFDAAVREPLHNFFSRCFRRDPRERFDNAGDMYLGWYSAFETAVAPPSSSTDELAVKKALESVQPATRIAELGLGTRAQNTLDRLNIYTAAQLIAEPLHRFSHLRGVGDKTRKDILALREKLLPLIPSAVVPERPSAAEQEPAPNPITLPSVDELTAVLLPNESANAGGRVGRQVLLHLLQLQDGPGEALGWPTQSQVAAKCGKAPAQVSQILTAARERWRRLPVLTPVRAALAEFILSEGGVVTIEELTSFLLASRGSAADETLARRRAAAVVRAALEADRPLESNRFLERRRRGLLLVAVAQEPYGEPSLQYAESLGQEAVQLANSDPLPGPARVLESLRAVPSPIPLLRNDRVVHLASLIGQVAVSPRLELYPRGMDATRALRLSQVSLAGLPGFTIEQLQTRVRERYPEAAPLPARPELDEALTAANVGMKWSEARQQYVAPTVPQVETSVTIPYVPTASVSRPSDSSPEADAASGFERRLSAAYKTPSFLVLATEPRAEKIDRVLAALKQRFPMQIFDAEREMIAAMRREAEAKKVKWEVVLRADSAPSGSQDFERLNRLAAAAAEQVAAAIRARSGPTLLLRPGLLARYGQLGVLEKAQDPVGLHSLWVLVGSDEQSGAPTAERQVIPARPPQWAWIPRSWLENEHRKYRGGNE
jgi:serine/threonine protein kinase